MGILLSLFISLLQISSTVGISPLTIRTKVHLDPRFLAGTVCLTWVHEDGEGSSDCWTVEDPPIRTWTKYFTLRTPGVWMVEVTEVGQDVKGKAMSIASPVQRIEVY
jgi:hypothetical protein